MQRVLINDNNSSHNIWWCAVKEKWHWCLIWEDGGPYGTHMHSGVAHTKEIARADIVKTCLWIENTWPTYEYFQGA
jgi:hypothetical protein